MTNAFCYNGPEPGQANSPEDCFNQHRYQGTQLFDGRLTLQIWNARPMNTLRMALRIEAFLVAARIIIPGDFQWGLVTTENWRVTPHCQFGFWLRRM